MTEEPLLNRVALVDQVATLLTRRILGRAYEPGQKLNIDALARELAVSSSPIREALTRLSVVGLVTSAPFTGFSVTPEPPLAWFEQLRDFRILNEGWAARQLARRRPAEAIAAMRASIEAMAGSMPRGDVDDYAEACRQDEAFHEAILCGADNEILAQAVRNLHPHLHHTRLFNASPHDVRPVLAEHQAILAAVTRGDEDAAQAAVANHLEASWCRYRDAQAQLAAPSSSPAPTRFAG